MVKLIAKGDNERDWDRIALKMLPVLIVALIVLMFLFNQSSGKVIRAYYNITNNTATDTENNDTPDFVLLPHHFLFIMILIATIVVVAFAVYILSTSDEDKEYVDASWG